ncbi:MAG TPA: class I SAM-dependent methyltransferase, partial [Solirubrobacteraceae bacterium]
MALLPPKLAAPLVDLVQGRPAARRALATARTGGRGEAPRPAYASLVHRLAGDCESVLDVGTGLMRSLAKSPCQVRIGLDAHRPYLEQREVAGAVPVCASALDLERLFVPGAVDLVQLIDVLEHFSVEDADSLLDQARTVATRRVVLFTPRGE